MPAAKRVKFLERLDALPGVKVETRVPDNGITASEQAARHGVTVQGMKYRLEKLVREGKLVTSWAMRDGSRVKVYRFPETE